MSISDQYFVQLRKVQKTLRKYSFNRTSAEQLLSDFDEYATFVCDHHCYEDHNEFIHERENILTWTEVYDILRAKGYRAKGYHIGHDYYRNGDHPFVRPIKSSPEFINYKSKANILKQSIDLCCESSDDEKLAQDVFDAFEDYSHAVKRFSDQDKESLRHRKIVYYWGRLCIILSEEGYENLIPNKDYPYFYPFR